MENNSAKPKVHGLITSSGNQLYLNPFQHHSPTLIVRVWKQTLHRGSSWSPASLSSPQPQLCISVVTIYFFFLISLVKPFSLTNHHFHSFWYCSFQGFCDLQYRTLALLCSVHSLLGWLLWCQLPVLPAPFLPAALLFPYFVFSHPAFWPSGWDISMLAEFTQLSVCSSLALPGPSSENVCWGRKDLRKRSSLSSGTGTGTACQPLPLDYALSPSFLCFYCPSFWCNRRTVWDEERAVGDSHWFSSPVDTTGVGIHLKELSLRLQCLHVCWVVLGWLTQLLAHCPSSKEQREKNKNKLTRLRYREPILLSTK